MTVGNEVFFYRLAKRHSLKTLMPEGRIDPQGWHYINTASGIDWLVASGFRVFIYLDANVPRHVVSSSLLFL